MLHNTFRRCWIIVCLVQSWCEQCFLWQITCRVWNRILISCSDAMRFNVWLVKQISWVFITCILFLLYCMSPFLLYIKALLEQNRKFHINCMEQHENPCWKNLSFWPMSRKPTNQGQIHPAKWRLKELYRILKDCTRDLLFKMELIPRKSQLMYIKKG